MLILRIVVYGMLQGDTSKIYHRNFFKEFFLLPSEDSERKFVGRSADTIRRHDNVYLPRYCKSVKILYL
jgi:hypothetical protein